MFKEFPGAVSEYPGVSCAMLFLDKTPMWFLIMVISQKAFTGFSKDSKGRAIISSKYSLLPEFIKTFNRGISARFSLWDKYQMDSHEQMGTNKLRNTTGITSSTCSRYLIIHLRYFGNPNMLPRFNQMLAQSGLVSFQLDDVKI